MSDTSDIVGYVGGGAGIVTGLVAFIRVLGSRIVEREDKDKEELKRRADERDKAERENRETLIGIKHDFNAMRSGFDQLARQMELRAETQDREIVSLRAEVKEQINQLEHRLRSDMQRIVTAGPRVRKGG